VTALEEAVARAEALGVSLAPIQQAGPRLRHVESRKSWPVIPPSPIPLPSVEVPARRDSLPPRLDQELRLGLRRLIDASRRMSLIGGLEQGGSTP
jgi:hypothetical protein